MLQQISDQQNKELAYLKGQNESLQKTEIDHRNEIIQLKKDYKIIEKQYSKTKSDLDIEVRARSGAVKKIKYIYIYIYYIHYSEYKEELQNTQNEYRIEHRIREELQKKFDLMQTALEKEREEQYILLYYI